MEFSHRNIVQKSIKAHLSPEATKKADVEPGSLVKLYTACIRSVLKYSCQVFHKSLPQYLSDKLERIQKRALETIFPDLNYKEATAKAKLGTLFERRETLYLCLEKVVFRAGNCRGNRKLRADPA